jgi:hypothetical protein
MRTNELFHEIGARLGVPSLVPNEANACAVRMDGDIQVEIQHEDGAERIALCATVMALSDHDRPTVQRQVLAANLRARDMQGMHFSLHPDRPELLLCASVEAADAASSRVQEAVEQLVALCRQWQSRLQPA